MNRIHIVIILLAIDIALVTLLVIDVIKQRRTLRYIRRVLESWLHRAMPQQVEEE